MHHNIQFFQLLWFISTGTFLWRKKCSFRELHFSEGTSYKIHTLGEREDYWSRSTLNMKGVFQSPALIYLYAGLGSRWTAIHNDWCHRSPSTIYTQGRRNSRVRGAIVIPPPPTLADLGAIPLRTWSLQLPFINVTPKKNFQTFHRLWCLPSCSIHRCT